MSYVIKFWKIFSKNLEIYEKNGIFALKIT